MQAERTRVDIVQCAKTYADGTRGLQATSLAVEPGEVLALLGPPAAANTLRLSPCHPLSVLWGLQAAGTLIEKHHAS